MALIKLKKNEQEKKIGAGEKSQIGPGSTVARLGEKLVLKRPLMNERAQSLAIFGKYVFSVESVANKSLIKKDIENRYGVKVHNVHIINLKGKLKRWANRKTRRSSIKKAIVTLRPGQKIDIG